MKKLTFGCVVAVVVGSAFAATYNVPGDYASLSDAMTVATNAGDTVVLAAQTHVLTNRVTVNKGVIVCGATGSWKDTIVSGNDTVQGLNLLQNAVVSNLTVRSCKQNGVTMAASSRLANCRVTGCWYDSNSPGGAWGIGVQASGGTVTNCVIDSNYVTSAAIGFSGSPGIKTSSSALITYTTITNNYQTVARSDDGYWKGAGGVYAGQSIFDHCYIGGNHVHCFTSPSGAYATGVRCEGAVTFRNCTIAENTWGTPVLNNVYGVTGHASVKISNTIIYGNGQEDGGFNDGELSAVKASNVDGLALGAANAASMTLATHIPTADDFVRIGGKLVVKASSGFASFGSEPAWNGSDPVDPAPAGTVYYVNAVADLQSTIDGAKAGDTVVIRKGTYPLTATITITTPGVTVRGETGKYGDVILDGQNARRCVSISGWRTRLENVSLVNARCNGDGGGLYVGIGAVVKNCRIADITYLSSYGAYTEGMGIYCTGGKILDSILENVTCQRAQHRTVGLYLKNGGEFNRGVIRNITATSSTRTDGYYTPNIGFLATHGVVANSVICNNSQGAAGSGSVVSGIGGSVSQYSWAVNCLVYNNTYNGSDTTIASHGLVGAGKIYNCIVLENGPLDADRAGHNYAASATHCNNYTDPATAEGSTASLSGTMADILVAEGDYWKVRSQSAIIDAGAAQLVLAQGNDFWQTNRLEGTAIDIGPFEYHQPALGVTLEAPTYTGLDRLDTTLTASVDGDTTGIGYAWYLDDAPTPFAAGGAEKASVPFSVVGKGTYVVKVVVTNAAAATANAAKTFTVTQGRFYVTNVNEHAEAPYDTWAKAATNIADAVSIAGEGASVVLAPGTYSVVSRIAVTNAITVRGAGTREETVVSGRGKNGLFRLATRGAALANLTVSDGYQNTFHGVEANVILTDGTLMTNCVVRNAKDGNNGYGGAVYNSNGKVFDSVISNCTGTSTGLGYYQTGNDAFADRLLVRDCRHSHPNLGDDYYRVANVNIEGGEMRNSMILDNTVTASGWIHDWGSSSFAVHMAGGKLVNCTVSGNVLTLAPALSNHVDHVGAVLCGGQIVNCLIAGNKGYDPAYADIVRLSATNALVTCCTYPFDTLPAGNVSSIDGGRVWRRTSDGLVRLMHGSPAIDAGTHQAWMDGGLDYYRRPRILNQEVDIGAVEVQRTGLTLLVR